MRHPGREALVAVITAACVVVAGTALGGVVIIALRALVEGLS